MLFRSNFLAHLGCMRDLQMAYVTLVGLLLTTKNLMQACQSGAEEKTNFARCCHLLDVDRGNLSISQHMSGWSASWSAPCLPSMLRIGIIYEQEPHWQYILLDPLLSPISKSRRPSHQSVPLAPARPNCTSFRSGPAYSRAFR